MLSVTVLPHLPDHLGIGVNRHLQGCTSILAVLERSLNCYNLNNRKKSFKQRSYDVPEILTDKHF